MTLTFNLISTFTLSYSQESLQGLKIFGGLADLQKNTNTRTTPECKTRSKHYYSTAAACKVLLSVQLMDYLMKDTECDHFSSIIKANMNQTGHYLLL